MPDLLHLMKMFGRGSPLVSLPSVEPVMKLSQERVTRNLRSQGIEEIMQTRKHLDLLKNHLALQIFTLAYSLFLFTALNLAMRCPVLSGGTRLGLI
jgi:hypothetical protein